MRILHVVPTYLPAVRYGGTIASVHGLCRALAHAGHEVDVFTTNVDGRGDSPVPLGVPVALDDVTVRYFPARHSRRLYRSTPMKSALRGMTGDHDVVHLHSIFLWPTWAAAREARRQGVPYLLSPHGMLEQELVRRRSPWVKRFWLALVERKNLEHAAAVHFTSERERVEAGRFGYRFRREVVIPNGVAADSAAREDRDDSVRPSAAVREAVADDRPYFLYLGRISWKKGLDRLVRALARVESVRLVVAGNDEEGYWPKVAGLAGDLGLGERVVAVGLIRGGDKERLFAGALALVLPSYSENFGNVVLEAMAAGCPVVVTPEVGAAQIVAREGSGLVVDGDPAALGPALAALARDPERRRDMAARGRAAAAGLSWEAVAQRMIDLYRTLPARRGAGR